MRLYRRIPLQMLQYKSEPWWIINRLSLMDKNNKATINPKGSDDRCFLKLTVVLNHENIGTNPERITKIRPFINQYKWKKLNFEIISQTIALNVLLSTHSIDEIKLTFISKHNSERENKVIFLIITDSEKWHYLAVKTLSTLIQGIILLLLYRCYCINCLHSFRAENKLRLHDYRIIVM